MSGWLYRDLPLFAYARRNDPEPSKLSAFITKEAAVGLRAIFVSLVREHGPCTANEAVEAIDNQYRAESVRKRASECEAMGAVRVVGTRACTVTGHQARVYEAVE